MTPHLQTRRVTLHHGDCREVLAQLPDASVDAVVTDPPYELGFMGKAWDASGVAYDLATWSAVLRVLKPGGHLLAFGGTRTYHRMTVAIEDAGFEIRDSIHWVYGSGFPKSLDVSKAIDKAAGAQREVVGVKHADRYPNGPGGTGFHGGPGEYSQVGRPPEPLTAPATPEAERWNGWGTALKPAHEPVVVARKPLEGTVAANVLAHGTGALNVDGCRVAAPDNAGKVWTRGGNQSGHSLTTNTTGEHQQVMPHDGGRWPANVVLTHHADCTPSADNDTTVVWDCHPECPVAVLDAQSGITKDGTAVRHRSSGNNFGSETKKPPQPDLGYGGQGGASRYFTQTEWNADLDGPSFRYVAKPDRAEREAGLGDLEAKVINTDTPPGTAGANSPRAGAGRNAAQQNFHPTVKPLDLMRWLVRLVTPPGGVVLDPFAGSGTTLAAAVLEGFDVVGIELTADYLPIIEGRCRWAEREARFGPVQGPTQVRKDAGAPSLFDEVDG